VIGLGLILFFGARTLNSFQQLRYIHEQGLDNGTARVEAIQPWMTIRFIAVAYAVPEEYIYSQLNIPFDRRNANSPLGQLNRDYDLGISSNGDYPAILDKARAAISAYRADPIVTGLREVRAWMSIQYIANSTGVPADYLMKAIGMKSDQVNKPLEIWVDETHYYGGPKAVSDKLQRALDQYEVAP
jgi:hypothetical protein